MHQPWRFALLAPSFRYLNGRQCAITRSYAYGLSWMRDCDGRVAVGHGGGLPGFGSNWTIFPSYGIGVMMFDNRTYGGSEAINLAVLDTIIALTKLKPRELPPSEILQKRAEQLAAMLPEWKSAEQSGLFAENFFLDNRSWSLPKVRLFAKL